MENEVEVIKQQMTETRTALSEKLGALEQQVVSTVKSTTETVAETVGAVKETVETATTAVSDTAQAVSDTFNISGHVEKYPWAVVGGCLFAGYAIGCILDGGPRSSPSWTGGAYAGPPAPDRQSPQENRPKEESATTSQGGLDSLLASWTPLVNQLKGLAIGVASGVAGEVLLSSVPESLKKELSTMVNQATEALGGKVLRPEEPKGQV